MNQEHAFCLAIEKLAGLATNMPVWRRTLAPSGPLSMLWRNTTSPLLLNQCGLPSLPLKAPP